jgi:hypothetical protein
MRIIGVVDSLDCKIGRAVSSIDDVVVGGTLTYARKWEILRRASDWIMSYVCSRVVRSGTIERPKSI